jgi:hypothetical protein
MNDQTQPPVEPGATQPLGQTPPTAQQPVQPRVQQPAPPGPYVDDPLAAPPAGVAAESQLTPRRTGSGLPKSTLAVLAVALLVVGGVVGALIGHSVGNDDTVQASGRNGFGNARGGYGLPGQGQQGQEDQQDQQGQQGPQGLGGPGRGLASGTVTAVDGDTITVKTADGRTVKVKVSDSTKYSVTKEGSKDDVKVGEQLLVTGRAGDDGTVDASTIRTGDQLTFQGRPGDTTQGN